MTSRPPPVSSVPEGSSWNTSGERKTESEVQRDHGAVLPRPIPASVFPAEASSSWNPSGDRKIEIEIQRDHVVSTDGFSQRTGMEAPLRPNRPPAAAHRWSVGHMAGVRRNRQMSNASATNPRYIAIQKMLLLNAYPLAYIILWIPGLANRLYEATGRSSPGLQIAQASWQLVGLANAVTYGWNEGVAAQFRKKFAGRRRGTY